MKKDHLKVTKNDVKHWEKTSSSSCYVEDIQSIVFGGLNSRFWMLRKHYNSMNRDQLSNRIPFYAWECLTLSLGGLHNRDVDLVIRDQSNMNKLMRFLINNLNTFDGARGSAQGIINALNKQGIDEYMKTQNSGGKHCPGNNNIQPCP
jgi:hypothetical protein